MEARLYADFSSQYLTAAKILAKSDTCIEEVRSPLYFLLLHSIELSLKAILAARGKDFPKSHDIARLAKDAVCASDLDKCRAFFRSRLQPFEQEIMEKWASYDGEYAMAAQEIELERLREMPFSPWKHLQLLGALGESKLTKFEFDQKIAPKVWRHAARYPRAGGVTSYPHLKFTIFLAEWLLKTAIQEATPT